MEATEVKKVRGNTMKLTARLCALALFLSVPWLFSWTGKSLAQGVKMTVGQTGINPGTGLYFIAQKENLFAKHGLNVNILKAGACKCPLDPAPPLS
jgi:ABC-type nitrate/sulfonate/bicarbonate transport system substrate-binding protein